jgi:hypothetical protein
VALYTRGLPADVRDARRAEIDSDLWEQRHLATEMREPPLGTAAEILARTALGMLSDITWRVQAGLSARPDRSISVNESLFSRALLLVALLFPVLPILMGAAVVVAGEDFDSWFEQLLFGTATIASGALGITGLLLGRRSRWLGAALVVVGTALISVLWYWMLVFTVPIGIVVTAIAFFRGRRDRVAPPNQPQPA